MSLQTRAEATGFRATSLHADVCEFIEDLEDLESPFLHSTGFGISPEGRELPLLVLSATGVTTAAEAAALGRPVVLIISGIHAGEVEGKEASLALVRDLLRGSDSALLEHLTLVVVPLFNPDGNDAIDPKNRKLDISRLQGQDGPESGVGTRVTASGINLDRDYMRHDAPEMRLLQQRVCQVWRPDLTIDTHATNGSVHRFDMTYDVPHTGQSGRAEPIDFMRKVLLPAITDQVRSNHGFESGWYGNFFEDEKILDTGEQADPGTTVGMGWMTYPHHPRFGSNYRGLGSRLDLLLECFAYLPFERRVATTYAWLLEALRAVAARADEVRQVVASSQSPRDRIAVRYRMDPQPEAVTVLTREPRTREGLPIDVRLPYFADFVGTRIVDRPRGYIVPGRLARFFQGHGLQVLSAPDAATVEVATFRGSAHRGGRRILEASGVGVRQASWKNQSKKLDRRALLVPCDQPLAAVAVYLCEPESDDGVVENGLSPEPARGEAFEIMRWVE